MGHYSNRYYSKVVVGTLENTGQLTTQSFQNYIKPCQSFIHSRTFAEFPLYARHYRSKKKMKKGSLWSWYKEFAIILAKLLLSCRWLQGPEEQL